MKGGNKMKKDKIFALCRMGVALVIAVVLLAVTGFGFVYPLAGAVEVTDGAELADNKYVSTDLKYIMTVCGEEVKADGTAVAYYAIAPVGDQFVILRFGAQAHGDVQTLAEATMDYLSGESSIMRVHMPVRGMAAPADAAVQALLSQWFEANKDWMSAAGVVGPEPMAEDYLCGQMIRVDMAGTMSIDYTVALSVLALLMVIYAIIELCFMLWGRKEPAKAEKKEKKEKKEAPKAEPAAVSEEAPAAEETPAEEVSEETAAAEEAEETEIEEAEEAEVEEAEEIGEETEEEETEEDA